MYTKNIHSLDTIFKEYRNQFFWYGVYVTVVYVAYAYLGIEELDIKMSIATVLGFTVSLLLGFRTSASYERWWEGRKIWGGIVNDSRTLVRQLIGFTDPSNLLPEVKQIAKYQMAWCYSLKNSLRQLDPLEKLEDFLPEAELEKVASMDNKPNEILHLMQIKLHQLRADERLDSFQMVAIDQTFKNLCDHMGKAERIKNTVFPTHYRSYTHKGIYIFILMLPYGMLLSTGPFVILISLLVLFFFSMLENIAYFLQDPFENRPSDIPMSALCNTIEINIKQMIDDPNLPEKVQPDTNGVLM